ncbi:hypothetical protein MNBD_IGNAVI01-1329 [hydrothermal vent metagenome]|uniref:Long-chain-fatty-acid--CoA ligase n=1 Tax=hydrothermal vent metagenome TaxID=652676 RepID=A0A3B1CYH9_9ZZZZ
MLLHQSDKTALIWKDQTITYNQLLLNITKYTTLFNPVKNRFVLNFLIQ